MPRTKIVYHEKYLTDYSTSSAECPERVKVIYQELKEHNYDFVAPQPADENDVYLVHHTSLVESEKKDSERYEIALLSLGGAITASEIAMEGKPAFAVIRPPGHHASPGSNWGFCFFNNAAITIQRLIARKKIERAVILDIDLHFGDGTDNFFLGRDDVKAANIQSYYRLDFIAQCYEELKEAAPYDIICVSAGFDRYVKDWGQTLETKDYKTIGETVKDFAQKIAKGRRFAILEGGYYLPDLGKNARSLIEGME
jgi:acetoin utilization deacetylase AcuC-like enzyme